MEDPKVLDVPCRYYRVYTDPDVPCDEKNFGFVERRLTVPVEQAALVLVDVWSTHYIDSWLNRAAAVTREKIAPLLQAARRAGITVVHAPSPYVVERHHPESMPSPAPAAEASDWPPAAFRGIYRAGEYAAFGRNQEPRLTAVYARYETELMIAEPARPLPGEPIIATGPQLHDLLTHRRILHLFYAGFATNWCVIGRDYGIIAMNGRGYNIILARDATTGIEFHDTVEALAATEITVREIETKYGWSTTTDGFVSACAALET
ncbi:MAG: cysteine hydrolase family protein [Acidobacteriota bacterium]